MIEAIIESVAFLVSLNAVVTICALILAGWCVIWFAVALFLCECWDMARYGQYVGLMAARLTGL